MRVHPSALYETIAYTLVFAILWRYRKIPHAPGALFWGYLVLSSLARFLIEFIRINPPLAFGLSEAQMISIVLMSIGTVMLMRRTANNPVAGTASPLHPVAREKQR